MSNGVLPYRSVSWLIQAEVRWSMHVETYDELSQGNRSAKRGIEPVRLLRRSP
jgi:hypothetical protein